MVSRFTFIDYTKVDAWVNAIEKSCCVGFQRYQVLTKENSSGWGKFFNLIN